MITRREVAMRLFAAKMAESPRNTKATIRESAILSIQQADIFLRACHEYETENKPEPTHIPPGPAERR